MIPIVHLQWQDAHANAGWHDDDEVAGWMKGVWLVSDIGYLIHETKAFVVFAQRFLPAGDASGNQQWGGLHKIPKGWIRNRKVIGYLTPEGQFTEDAG